MTGSRSRSTVRSWTVRHRGITVAIAIALGGLILHARDERETDPVTDTFCMTYGDLHHDIEQINQAISGEVQPGAPTLETLQGVAILVWGDRVARGGPPTTDEDASEIAAGVRAALATTDPSPLETARFRTVEGRLATAAARACDGRPT